jgi:hypothetical protein
MTRRSNAPYWILTRYGGQCANPRCRRGIKKGEEALYFPDTCRLLCNWEPCGRRAKPEVDVVAARSAKEGADNERAK